MAQHDKRYSQTFLFLLIITCHVKSAGIEVVEMIFLLNYVSNYLSCMA